MSPVKIARVLTLIGFGVIASLYAFLGFSFFEQQGLKNAYENRITSLALAAELGQSSQDLTRYARTYVVTGSDEYEKKYWEVLAIRNGEQARPDGRKMALKDLMKSAGFTADEFALLSEAESRSNALVAIETEAMNAVKGLFKDAAGNYTVKQNPDMEKARKLMHDQIYHKYAAEVMVPINQFFKAMNTRIAGETSSSFSWALFAQSSVGLLIVILSVCLILSSRFTNKAIRLEVVSLQAASTEGQEIADDGQKVVESMLNAIDQISSSTNHIVDQVKTGNEEISQIVVMMKEIDQKTKFINDIVFQTKLLSFNASVEAARAGEHGKGFAVVAEEVGNLSRMSGQASNEITELLNTSLKKVEDILSSTGSRVQNMITESTSVIGHTNSTAQTCQESLHKILGTMKQIDSMVGDITRASTEQESEIKQINVAMNQIDSITQVNANASIEVAQIVEDM